MASNLVLLPYPYIGDPTRSRALSGGKIYIGEVDKDPETFPIDAFYIQEDGTEIPTPIGIPIGAGGYVVYNGKVVQVGCNENYSMRVRDKHGAQVYNVPNNYATGGATKDFVVEYVNSNADLHDTLAGAKAKADLVVGMAIRIEDLEDVIVDVVTGEAPVDRIVYQTDDPLYQLKLRLDGVANLKKLGAKGGDATADTGALLAAFNSKLPVLMPSVGFDDAYIFSGEIEIPKNSIVFGSARLKGVFTDADARLVDQAYITFADTDSFFWGGSAAEDRVSMFWSDLMFISAGGTSSGTGTAIGRGAGNANSAMGGNCQRLLFAGFEDAWINDWAYFLDVKGLDLAFNKRGLTFDNWNSSSLSTVFCKNGGEYYIDTGGDSARSTFRDIGVNMNSVQIGIRFEGGATFSGYCYFETFGPPGITGQTCIATSVGTFNAKRPVGLENILFGTPDSDYCITIGGNQAGAVVQWPGIISKCNFASAVKPIGFGIHPRSNGNPTYPNTIIKGLDLDSCSGINKGDLIGTPYQDDPITLNAYLSAPIVGFAPGTATYEKLPMSISDAIATNDVNVVDGNNNAILRNARTYEATYVIRLKNQTATRFTAEGRMRHSGSVIDSAIQTVPAKNGSNEYGTMIMTALIENTTNAGTISAEFRNSCEIIDYSLTIKQLYSEV